MGASFFWRLFGATRILNMDSLTTLSYYFQRKKSKLYRFVFFKSRLLPKKFALLGLVWFGLVRKVWKVFKISSLSIIVIVNISQEFKDNYQDLYFWLNKLCERRIFFIENLLFKDCENFFSKSLFWLIFLKSFSI